MGEYYTAFFGLSVGLERLAKLILVADHAISNSGQMPTEKVIRHFGHKLMKLMDAVDAVVEKNSLTLRYPRPTAPICVKIVECLDAFADASRGRYANFAALGDPSLGKEEPIRKWWNVIAEGILQEHYYGKSIQGRVETNARIVDALLAPVSTVHFTNETGDAMQDALTSSVRTGQTKLVQSYGRYYTLMIVRWLSDVFSKLSNLACYTHNVGAFFGSWEYFWTYTVDDSFLKTRKNWPLT